MNTDMLFYALKVLFCSGILWILYYFFLQDRIPLTWCRGYLLFSMVASAAIPLLKIPLYPGQVMYVPGAVLQTVSEEQVLHAAPQSPQVLMYIYLSVVLLAGVGILWQFYRIFHLWKNGNKEQRSLYTLVRHHSVKTPFSFFRNIFLLPSIDRQEEEQIVAHEKSHIRHRHSVDLVFAEFIGMLLWFNPFVYIMRKSLVEVHEYQADRDVIAQGYDPVAYKTLIFKQLVGYTPEIANRLNHSLTKKRFTMMTKNKKVKYPALRAAFALPVIAALMLLFSFTRKSPEIHLVQQSQIAPAGIELTAEKVVLNAEPVVLYAESAATETPQKRNQKKAEEVKIYVNGVETDVKDLKTFTVEQKSQVVLERDSISENLHVYINNHSDSETITHKVTTSGTVASITNSSGEVLSVEDIKGLAGTPASIRVVGRSSNIDVNNTQVLFLVDGVKRTSLTDINPKDIESMTVLKGNAAVEAHGEEARQGVVVITTKK